MKRLLRAIVLSLAVSWGWGLTYASASSGPEMSFYFAGLCSDCEGTARAELVLQDYTLGDTIADANLVFFTYAGTNLLSGFTITPGQNPYIYGVIDSPFPAGENVIVFSSFGFFESSAGGHWCAGLICGGDQGAESQWSAAAVPEPAAWAMMVLGLAALGCAGHRRATAA